MEHQADSNVVTDSVEQQDGTYTYDQAVRLMHKDQISNVRTRSACGVAFGPGELVEQQADPTGQSSTTSARYLNGSSIIRRNGPCRREGYDRFFGRHWWACIICLLGPLAVFGCGGSSLGRFVVDRIGSRTPIGGYAVPPLSGWTLTTTRDSGPAPSAAGVYTCRACKGKDSLEFDWIRWPQEVRVASTPEQIRKDHPLLTLSGARRAAYLARQSQIAKEKGYPVYPMGSDIGWQVTGSAPAHFQGLPAYGAEMTAMAGGLAYYRRELIFTNGQNEYRIELICARKGSAPEASPNGRKAWGEFTRLLVGEPTPWRTERSK